MYGIINICVRELIVTKFGESTWEQIRTKAGVDETFSNFHQYNDDVTYTVVKVAADMLGVTHDYVWDLFGVYWVVWCLKNGYDGLFRTLGGNLKTFLSNLDFLHSVYMKTMYSNMTVPQFRVEDIDDHRLCLHYYSSRRSLSGVVAGIVKGVSRIIFHTDITIEKTGFQLEEYIGIEKSHYTFLITFIATDLHEIGHGGLVKEEDWMAIFERKLTNDTKEMCDIPSMAKCPMNGIVKFGQENTELNKKQKIPEKVLLDGQTFCDSFPYHVLFDKNMVVKHCGVKLQEMCPDINKDGAKLTDFIILKHPVIPLDVDKIRLFIHNIFMAEILRKNMDASYQDKPPMLIRGQMIWMEACQFMVFLCSPRITNLQDLRDRGMHFSDIAPHDITRDLVLFNQQREAEVELAKQLEEKKEELRIIMKDLEIEKQKTDTLLYSMLPKEIANDLRDGRTVEAGEYEQVTILFSDIVHFTTICSACEPMQIVHLLNEMYIKFDQLTNVHKVYKVETIGDAYMVVGGIPIQSASHAESVARFAMDQQLAVVGVTSPIASDPIMIRVGIHTGPVVAGVVGVKMPRYCLFGDTVNTASRMESNGLPGKVHCSEELKRALEGNSEFTFVERGDINVKGKGMMKTYFVSGKSNDITTDIESLGTENNTAAKDIGDQVHADDAISRGQSKSPEKPKLKADITNHDTQQTYQHVGATNHEKPRGAESGPQAVNESRVCVIL